MKTSNSKLQTPNKLQTSNFKSHGSGVHLDTATGVRPSRAQQAPMAGARLSVSARGGSRTLLRPGTGALRKPPRSVVAVKGYIRVRFGAWNLVFLPRRAGVRQRGGGWSLVFGVWCFVALDTGAAETNSDFPEKLLPLQPLHPELPPSLWEQHSALIITGAILILALAGLLLWRLLRPSVATPVPPAFAARQTLEPLRARSEDGATLSLISQALRHYTTAAFTLPAQEMTTTEFCRAISAHDRIGSELSAGLADFLSRCDERKFAPPSPVQPLDAVNRAFRFIDQLEETRTRTNVAGQAGPLPPK